MYTVTKMYKIFNKPNILCNLAVRCNTGVSVTSAGKDT